MNSLFPDFGAVPRRFFLDMNSFYCSVEQQEQEGLRGKPTIVVPVLAEHTCAIAASHEAKALGIRTGTAVAMARMLCPTVRIVEAQPKLYLDYHTRLVTALKDHFVSIRALSVDEVACRVPSLYQSREKEAALATRVKAHLAHALGPLMTCSVGIAPNVFLAKVASETQKPDGLTVWDDHCLPEALFGVKLSNLPGVGPAMKRRLGEAGILTTEALWNATPEELTRVWGGVVGARWHYMLRGSHECDYQPMQTPANEPKKSVGHSNVLAPDHRSRAGAERILLELTRKALTRLKSYRQAASGVHITVKYRGLRGNRKDWIWTQQSTRHLHTNDERIWMQILRPLFAVIPDLAPEAEPAYVGIVFSKLLLEKDRTLSLFEEDEEQARLAQTVATMNKKHGRIVEIGGLSTVSDQIPLRIPFGAPEPH
jgi:DNA polymerase-4